MRPSGVGTPNAVGVGELYHGYLWTMFQRDLADDRAAPTNMALFLAVYAIKQTAGPRGISPVSRVRHVQAIKQTERPRGISPVFRVRHPP